MLSNEIKNQRSRRTVQGDLNVHDFYKVFVVFNHTTVFTLVSIIVLLLKKLDDAKR